MALDVKTLTVYDNRFVVWLEDRPYLDWIEYLDKGLNTHEYTGPVKRIIRNV